MTAKPSPLSKNALYVGGLQRTPPLYTHVIVNYHDTLRDNVVWGINYATTKTLLWGSVL
jgi:hypothetical protein